MLEVIQTTDAEFTVIDWAANEGRVYMSFYSIASVEQYISKHSIDNVRFTRKYQ